MGAAWISLFLLSYPQTDFIVHTIRGPAQFHIGLSTLPFTLLLFTLGVAFACGMASNIYVGDDFPQSMGVVTGIVGLVGALGGFVLPIIFGIVLDWLGHQLQLFHVSVWRRLGIADPELHDGGAAFASYGRTDIGQRSGCAHYAGSGIMSHFLERLTYSARRRSCSLIALAIRRMGQSGRK